MKFRLIATSMPYNMDGDEADYLKDYIKMIDDAGYDALAYIIENGKVYVNIFYGSDIVALAKILNEELIVSLTQRRDEPTIEIYNDWRE